MRLYRSSTSRPTFRQLGDQLGVHHEALRNWVRQADAGERDDRPTSAENEDLRRMVVRATQACSAASVDAVTPQAPHL